MMTFMYVILLYLVIPSKIQDLCKLKFWPAYGNIVHTINYLPQLYLVQCVQLPQWYAVYFQEKHESAISDCSEAIKLNPTYLKAIMRRAELYEKTDKLDEALDDYKKTLELDPSQHAARFACMVTNAAIILVSFELPFCHIVASCNYWQK